MKSAGAGGGSADRTQASPRNSSSSLLLLRRSHEDRSHHFKWLPRVSKSRWAGMDGIPSLNLSAIGMLIEITCTYGCSVLTMTSLAFLGGTALKQVVLDIGHSAIPCVRRR